MIKPYAYARHDRSVSLSLSNGVDNCARKFFPPELSLFCNFPTVLLKSALIVVVPTDCDELDVEDIPRPELLFEIAELLLDGTVR